MRVPLLMVSWLLLVTLAFPLVAIAASSREGLISRGWARQRLLDSRFHAPSETQSFRTVKDGSVQGVRFPKGSLVTVLRIAESIAFPSPVTSDSGQLLQGRYRLTWDLDLSKVPLEALKPGSVVDGVLPTAPDAQAPRSRATPKPDQPMPVSLSVIRLQLPADVQINFTEVLKEATLSERLTWEGLEFPAGTQLLFSYTTSGPAVVVEARLPQSMTVGLLELPAATRLSLDHGEVPVRIHVSLGRNTMTIEACRATEFVSFGSDGWIYEFRAADSCEFGGQPIRKGQHVRNEPHEAHIKQFKRLSEKCKKQAEQLGTPKIAEAPPIGARWKQVHKGTLIPGQGLGKLRLGEPAFPLLTDVLGDANLVTVQSGQELHTYTTDYFKDQLYVVVTPPGKDGRIAAIGVDETFPGMTNKGVRIGDALQHVLESHGKPTHQVKRLLIYADGTAFSFGDCNLLVGIQIRDPRR